jgi:hypothetical protein
MDKLYIIKMIEKGDSLIEHSYKTILELEETMDIIYFHDTLEEIKRLLSTCKENLIELIHKKMMWITQLVVNFEESTDDKYKKELDIFVKTPVIDYEYYKRTKEIC